MGSADSACPVCDTLGVSVTRIESAKPRTFETVECRTHSDDAFLYECSECGRFAVTQDDRADFLEKKRERDEWKPRRLSALLREQMIRGLPAYWVQFSKGPYGPLKSSDLTSIHVDELLAQWPRTVPERIDRTLCNLARESQWGGQSINLLNGNISFAFAEKEDEAEFHVGCLLDRKYLKDSGSSHDGTEVMLTAKGWKRYERLTRGAGSPKNPVFVAMCFGVGVKKRNNDLTKEEMKDLYDRAIEPAVEKAGYLVTRVDLEEHNEWIMDKVLGDIRLAPFVVADFTGNRNGVYFEAGFARGLGIPVIHTCRKDHLEKAHFDTQQLNHVVWQTPEELHEGLYNRIMGAIGRGPHPTPNADQ